MSPNPEVPYTITLHVNGRPVLNLYTISVSRARRLAKRLLRKHTVQTTWQLRRYAPLNFVRITICGMRVEDHDAETRYVPSAGEIGWC